MATSRPSLLSCAWYTSPIPLKVLDFGLAKAFAGDRATEDIGHSPTLSMAATIQVVILGTAAYMSPEQRPPE
jgi:serine/threonine protein kinase